jgi:hypothetical protein
MVSRIGKQSRLEARQIAADPLSLGHGVDLFHGLDDDDT